MKTKEMYINAEGNLGFGHIYTGFGPIEGNTYFEEAVYQSIMNDSFFQLCCLLKAS
ncbi:MAG: hypothetical protein AAGA66_13820 [Bacteroidota bacterium]